MSDLKSKIQNPKSEIRLICFDLGRVLIRICDSWQHGCRVAGVPVPEYPLATEVRARLMNAVVESETGRVDIGGFSALASRELGLDASQLRAVSDVYLIEPFAGADALLDEIRAAGFSTACLSNTNDNHWRICLEESGPFCAVMKRLDHQFGSHLIGTRKPDPRIYQHVEDETGVPGESIVFFDDLIENVEAARKRGWIAEQIHREPNPVEQMRGHLVRMGLL